MFTDAENSCNDRVNSIKISGKEANSKKTQKTCFEIQTVSSNYIYFACNNNKDILMNDVL